MKLGQCEAWNFGSYSHIEFDFSNVGLGLIYGKTGSGKSMLADLPCWVLYGITAKNGAADEVRSWQSPDQPTKGVLDVQLPEGSITVTRVRGKSGQNDLYWTESKSPDEKQRGKDLSETQKRLSERLGVDATLYLSAGYFCDFSPSGQFFVSKASARRELFEKIASLHLPVKLAEKTSEARKAAKKGLEKSEMDLARASGRLEQLTESHKELTEAYDSWDERHAAQVKALTEKIKPAEVAFIKDELKELDALKPELRKAQTEYQEAKGAHKALVGENTRLQEIGNDKCPYCLGSAANPARASRLVEISRLQKKSKISMDDAQTKIDRFEAALEKESGLREDLRKLEQAQIDLDRLEKTNPFAEQIQRADKDRIKTALQVENLQDYVASDSIKVARLTRLYDLSFDLRGEMLRKAVKQIEDSTNSYLEKYFDAEIRVYFLMEGSDDLEVLIQKSGFECSFRQLSKGQRQLLKLCFSVSIMAAAANSAGVHFDNLFFDEALDELDDDLKVKAFGLFSELESNHESILMIDHAPAFQSLFAKKYHVTMDSDVSSIELEHE